MVLVFVAHTIIPQQVAIWAIVVGIIIILVQQVAGAVNYLHSATITLFVTITLGGWVFAVRTQLINAIAHAFLQIQVTHARHYHCGVAALPLANPVRG